MLGGTNPEPNQKSALSGQCPNPSVQDFHSQLGERIQKLSKTFDVEVIGEVGFLDSSLPIYRVSSKSLTESRPNILLTAGVHGNEKGGVEGALGFLENEAEAFKEQIGLVCFPCINPRGYLLNTRWNGDSPQSLTDINRSFIDGSTVEEVKLVSESLRESKPQEFLCALDLHETLPDDAEIMAMQYPDRESNAWEATPNSFYMYEVCQELSRRVGSEVIEALEPTTRVCKWPTIFGDTNTGGVIFYPEGAQNEDYVQGTSLDSFVYGRYTDHAFTTETYGDVSIEKRGAIQRRVIQLVVSNLLKKG